MAENLETLWIISERFFPEEFLINDLATDLAARGLKVNVLTQAPSYPFDKIFQGYQNKFYQTESWKDVRIHRIVTILGYKKYRLLKILNYLSFMLLSTLFILYQGRRCKNIFIYHTGPLTQAFGGALHSKLFGSRLTIWTQDLWPETVHAYGYCRGGLSKKILDAFVSFIYQNTAQVLVSSPGFKNHLSRFTNGRIEFVPQWSKQDWNLNIHANRSWRKGVQFTFTGNISAAQNLHVILEGFGLAITRMPNLIFNIFGDGSEKLALESFMQKKAFKNNIIFWGRVPETEIPTILNESDFLILPLRPEIPFNLTIPAKFQSYLRAGKPIIAFDNGTVRDIVNKEQLGFATSELDKQSIADVLLQAASLTEQNISEIGGNCLRFHNLHYQPSHIKSKISQLICQRGGG